MLTPATGSVPARQVSVLLRSRASSNPARHSRNPRRCASVPKRSSKFRERQGGATPLLPPLRPEVNKPPLGGEGHTDGSALIGSGTALADDGGNNYRETELYRNAPDVGAIEE
jgi:hypothetical protein